MNTHRELGRRAVPLLRQREPHVLLKIVDHDLAAVGLVAVLVELDPRHLVSLCIEDRRVRRALLARRELSGLRLAVQADDVYLRRRLVDIECEDAGRTFCLVCHAGESSGSLVVYTMLEPAVSKSSVPPNGSTGVCWESRFSVRCITAVNAKTYVTGPLERIHELVSQNPLVFRVLLQRNGE